MWILSIREGGSVSHESIIPLKVHDWWRLQFCLCILPQKRCLDMATVATTLCQHNIKIDGHISRVVIKVIDLASNAVVVAHVESSPLTGRAWVGHLCPQSKRKQPKSCTFHKYAIDNQCSRPQLLGTFQISNLPYKERFKFVSEV